MADKDNLLSKMTDTANVYLTGVVSGVSGIASSVGQGVGSVVSSVSSGVGSVVHGASSGVGDVVHNVTSGVKRMVMSPPESGEEDRESPSLPPETPHLLSGSPVDYPGGFLLPSRDPESMKEEAAIDLELGIDNEHFSLQEGEGESGIKGLETRIELCKDLILKCEESSARRRMLVHKLIQMRLKLQEAKEEEEIAATGVHVIQGHHLSPTKPVKTQPYKQYCDRCAQVIWGVIHVSFSCSMCGYQCHSRCLERIQRRCAGIRAAEDPSYILRICPEVGLAAQNYKCAECRVTVTYTHLGGVSCFGDAFSKDNAWCEPRRCDYTGLYFCPMCHWYSRCIMPARVTHNWDFDERYVSCQAKQFLRLMQRKPILHLEKLNPHLFKFVEELNTVKKMREDMLVMKQYLRTCRTAQENRMLIHLEKRQHFVENAYMYSLQDLIDIHTGVLLQYLEKVYKIFESHIKEECLVCRGKGFICEICDIGEIIFPFDGGVIVCSECNTCLHHICYTKRNQQCPRCVRQQARKKQLE
ncbi:differentially expressed in FDCP 8 homolog isoform X1 [Oratosquilla oratoria]|uniref:differentially expressed in FDCP 8 homolog isoform X1 n=1 Tax=Oratosquilla oratoria TaxID=337810 RepID=UPI003F76CEF5